jgi:hypothetical protein
VLHGDALSNETSPAPLRRQGSAATLQLTCHLAVLAAPTRRIDAGTAAATATDQSLGIAV